jgi:hypothetical protein
VSRGRRHYGRTPPPAGRSPGNRHNRPPAGVVRAEVTCQRLAVQGEAGDEAGVGDEAGGLRAIAYRMPGSLSDADDADDAVQEAWLRLSRADAGEVDTPYGRMKPAISVDVKDEVSTGYEVTAEPGRLTSLELGLLEPALDLPCLTLSLGQAPWWTWKPGPAPTPYRQSGRRAGRLPDGPTAGRRAAGDRAAAR